MNQILEDFHLMSYKFAGLLGAFLGTSWSFVRLFELGIEALFLGAMGAVGSMGMKWIAERMRDFKKKYKNK